MPYAFRATKLQVSFSLSYHYNRLLAKFQSHRTSAVRLYLLFLVFACFARIPLAKENRLITSNWLGAAATLPEVLLAVRCSSISTLISSVMLHRGVAVARSSRGGRSVSASVLTSLTAATKQHQNHSEKQRQHRSKYEPHRDVKLGVGASGAAIVVDLVLDDAPHHKVHHHRNQCDQPGKEGQSGGDQGTNYVGAESSEEGDECEAAGDGVQDHDVCEAGGGLGGCAAVIGVGEPLQNVQWAVADGGAGTLIRTELC